MKHLIIAGLIVALVAVSMPQSEASLFGRKDKATGGTKDALKKLFTKDSPKCDAEEFNAGDSLKHAEVCVPMYPEIFKIQMADSGKPQKDDELAYFHRFFMQRINFKRLIQEDYEGGDVYQFMKSHWSDKLKYKIMSIPISTSSLGMCKGIHEVQKKFSMVSRLISSKESEIEHFLFEPCKKFIDANELLKFFLHEKDLLLKAGKDKIVEKGSEDVGRFDFYIAISKYRMCKNVLEDADANRRRYINHYDLAMSSEVSAQW